MTTPKEFHATVQAFLQWKIDNCKCGGKGKSVSSNCGYTQHCGDADCDASYYCEEPCPTCAPYRALLEGKYRCWHEWTETWDEQGKQYFISPDELCEKCGDRYYIWKGKNPTVLDRRNDNPTFSSISELKLLMVELGEWDGFAEWHSKMCRSVSSTRANIEWRLPRLFDHKASVEICTTPTLLRQACTSYLKERTG